MYTHLAHSNNSVHSILNHVPVVLQVDVVQHVGRGQQHGSGISNILADSLTEGVARTLREERECTVGTPEENSTHTQGI